MNSLPCQLIAVVGGSGSGKTWLIDRLVRAFSPDAACLSLDDFYFDFSHVPVSRRDGINFDEPDAIDWSLFEMVLRECGAGEPLRLPQYDFARHTRLAEFERWTPKPLIFVDGLWLLWRPGVRALFDLRIFLDCPESMRWGRRLARDVAERGRTPDSVREQFWSTVAPMHARYVEPQAAWADVVLRQPLGEAEIPWLIELIGGHQREGVARWSESANAHPAY